MPKPLRISDVAPISLAFTGFVVFNNLSLQYNAVGVYQILKVMTTPVILMVQHFCYSTVDATEKQLMALVPIIVGVVMASVTRRRELFGGPSGASWAFCRHRCTKSG